MPLVVTSVPNLAQGVSQQPDNLRYPGQCDEQVNAWATVVEGLVKRPNTRWVNEFNSDLVADINDGNPSNLFTHFVKRDEQNKYCVQVSLGGGTPSLGVINLETGASIPVATTSIANNYLSGITNPLADLRALTVADYTFIVNKKKTVAKSDSALHLSSTPEKEALISVKLGDYEKGYSVYINDSLVPLASTIATNPHSYTHHGHQEATYISGPSSGTGAGKYADTEYIAKDLYTCIDEAFASGPTTGISAVNITANTGTGWFQNLANDLIIDGPTKVTFFVDQTVGGVVNRSAYGLADFDENGTITSATVVNSGSDYNTDQVTYPITVTFLGIYRQGSISWKVFSNSFYSSLPTQPTYTVTTASFGAFEVEREGSVIKVRPGDRDFRIRVEDGLANQGLGLAYKEVDSVVDLPKSCFNNFTIKVKGDPDIDQDDYYVYFKVKDGSNFGEGAWVETVGWNKDDSEAEVLTGIETKVKADTMPITLVPVFTGSDITSFKLQTPQEDQFNTVVSPNEVGWRTRKAGDDNTNPFPSFVGSKINDVFFFKNRLGFLTDSAVVFSEADEYFNFFRTTTQQLLDSAPIDVGLSHTKVAVLQHALPFQEKLVLFSDNSQFVLRGADVLSPKTVAISPVTEYDISDGIAPLALGPYIYFPFNRGQFEGMFEYFVDNNTEVFEAEEITSQIPKYIPSSIKRMAGSASESMVLLQDDTNQNLLYVYKYFWSNKEKIQSAWQKWEFDDNVTGFDFIDSTLYLILDGKTLVEMPVENALTDEGLDYTLLLDNRVDGSVPSVSYDSLDNETTISNLPDGYGVEVTTDVDGNVTSTNVAVYTKGGSGRTVSGSGASTTVKIDGFIASYVDNGGDYVEYDGDYYYCIISHTSASTFESKYWRKAAYPPSGTTAWAASTSYSKGTIYKCINNHTSPADPATFSVGTEWSVSTEVPSAPEWGNGIFYNDQYYFVVGKLYNMLYRFSNQALKQPTERGGRSASDYTYQTVRNASIEYADTGHFTVEVTPRFRDKYTYVYNPALLSSISTLDRFTPESGHFRFGVQCRPEEATIEVKSSSALPVKLLAAEFESMVTGRSRRYGA
jgi:hypothetical protein